MLRIAVFLFLPLLTSCCTLCPLRVPPRPRPLDQYKLPQIPDVNVEKMPPFCNISKTFPIEPICRKQFERIFCSAEKLIESFTSCDQNGDQCSKCAYQKKNNMWVVDWLDSVGKPAAGVSDGNYYWLGDYEICQALTESGKFLGQYCRIEFEVPDSLIESGCAQTDPLAIFLGVCFPSACNVKQLYKLVSHYSPYKLKIDCESEVGSQLPAILLGLLLAIFVSVQLYATFYRGSKAFWLKLSIVENANRALSTKREQPGLHALHGLEFLTFFWLTTANVYNLMLPYIENVAFSFDGVSSLFMHLTNNYSYQVDGLFALSALYTTYLLYGNINSKIEILHVIKDRLVRFWPSYLLLVLFMTFGFAGLTRGPMWIHTEIAERCVKFSWTNLLFITDFFSASSTCVDFGYAISLEAQYFVLLVVLVYFAKDHLLITKIIASVTLLLSCGFTFYRVYTNALPPAPLLTAEPMDVTKMNEYLSKVLTSPLCRIAPHCLGFLFGVNLIPPSEKKISTLTRWILFVPSLGFAIFTIVSLFDYAKFSYGHAIFLALYASLHRAMWSFSLLSFLLLCHQGQFGWIQALLSWRIFSPLSKLTWIAVVISEPVILFFFTALSRPSYATNWSCMYAAVSAATMSYLIAFGLDVFVARPLRNLFSNSKLHHEVEQANESNESE